MPRLQFFILLFVTSLNTYFFNQALLATSYLWAGFWFFMLYRNVRLAYLVTRYADWLEHFNK